MRNMNQNACWRASKVRLRGKAEAFHLCWWLCNDRTEKILTCASFLDPGSHVTQSLKPPQLPATPKPLVAGTKMHPAYLPATIPDAKTLGKGSTVTLSSNATESKPAVAASVVTSNKSTNVTLSIGHVNAPNVTSGRQVTLARSFTNVTVGRADQLKGVLDKLVTLLDEHSGHGSVTGKYCVVDNGNVCV